MRVSSIVLFLLAAIMVSSSGCKLGSKRGVSATRVASRNVIRRVTRDRSATSVTSSLATRGTAECDCYTCRMKRQADKDYLIDQAYEPVNSPAEQESAEQPVFASPSVDSNIVQPQIGTLDSQATQIHENNLGQTLSVDAFPNQEIQGQVIEDDELTNELPPDPEADTPSEIPTIPEANQQLELTPAPEADPQPQLISPKTSFHLKSDPQEFSPVIRSAPIEAKKVSAPLKETRPQVNESVFKLKSPKSSVIKTRDQIDTNKPRRGHSIWFAPIERQENDSAKPRSTKIKSTPDRTQRPQTVAAPSVPTIPTIIPVIEHDSPEVEQQAVRKSIVLKARPVDRHMIYNSRPFHAPVREARLPENSRYAMSHRQPTPDRMYFQPLPPEERRWMSPAPAPVASGFPADPETTSLPAQPLPKPENDSAQLRIKAKAVPPANQTPDSKATATPMARVVKPNNPMLKLKAVQTGGKPEKLPSIVSIQPRHQDRVVVGSLQPPRQESQEASANFQARDMNRLHTTPWQPMQTSEGGVQQVQQSIRQLMIQPQQEANFATDGIHR